MNYSCFYEDKRLQRLLSLVLALCLLLFSIPTAWAEGEGYTNRQAADKIATACDDYTGLTAADILGSLSPDSQMTHASCAEMLYRGFGELPEATGFRAMTGYRDTAFTDVPEEIAVYVNNLTNAMIYIPENNELFQPDGVMGESELLLLLDRIYAYLGTNIKDDFYTTVNSDLLMMQLPDYLSPDDWWSSTYNDDWAAFMEWLMALLESSGESDELYMKNIAAFYSTYISREARENGTPRLKAYIDDILAATNAEELMAVIERIGDETGFPLLLARYDFYNDYTDNDGNYLLVLLPSALPSDVPEDYLPGGAYYSSDSIYCLTQAMMLTGLSEDTSNRIACTYTENIANLLPLLADGALSETTQDTFDISAYLNLCGYTITEDTPMGVDTSLLLASLHLMSSPDTFQAFQYDCVIQMLEFARDVASPRITDWMHGYWVQCYDLDMSAFLEDGEAIDLLFPELCQDICQAFFAEFDMPAETAKLEAMFEILRAEFAEMIPEETWLSESTKEAALDKLSAVKIYIGTGNDILNQERAAYVPASQGSTLFDNYCLYRRVENANFCRYLGQNAYDFSNLVNMMMPLSDTCCYYSSYNIFFISLPTLYNDFMCADSTEAYYSGAFTLGHELMHGFDINGSKYNAQGEIEDWWQPEDKARFEALCEQVAVYYGQTEFAPGLASNSMLHIGEDMADMGSLQLLLAAAEKIEGFDYDAFFRQLVRRWQWVASRNGYMAVLYPDEHATNRARFNPLLSLMDKFYETYGITEADGMYVPPEERVRVW